jgi:hypothetical protein
MNTTLMAWSRVLLSGLLLPLIWPALGAAQVQGTLEADDQFGFALAAGDFNGDGHTDLAVGAPEEDVSALGSPVIDAGTVNVIYGTAGGLDDAANQWWGQNSPNVEDGASETDRFAYSLAAGDFNGDGYDDLAVGVPYEDIGRDLTDAGAVNVLYGAAAGLSANVVPDQLWHADVAGVPGAGEDGDRFGYALASGDFDGDGFDDLAVGLDGEAVGTLNSAGAVDVLYGAATGLTATGSQIWYQDIAGVLDVSEAFDYFGVSLAVGDFDADGFDDLAIGVHQEDVGSVTDAGAVNVLYGGTGAGLSATGSQLWHQDSPGVLDQAEYDASFGGDRFGNALASGDFDGDGFDDLAVGVLDEGIGGATRAGAVNVLYGGTGAGLSAAGNQFWHQDVSGVLDASEAHDILGRSLTAADFDGDDYADLAVGVAGEDLGSFVAAGAVNVFYGGAGAGLSATGDEFWHQDVNGVLDLAEHADYFGVALAAGDFGGEAASDLAVGAPLEDVSFDASGGVNVLYGSFRGGLVSIDDQFWYQGGTGTLREREGEHEEAGPPPSALATEVSSPALLPPAPNPFRGSATLRFTLPAASAVRLTVYDALGRAVAVLVDEAREAGQHAVAFEAAALPAGVYVARLEAGGQARSQRLTVLR